MAVTAAPVRATVTLPSGWGARATITHLRVDETHGDAYTVWTSQGSPATPSAAQRTALLAAMEPSPLEPARTVDVVGGAVTLDFDLPRFGVSLITLTPEAAGDGGAPDAGGTDAATSDGGGAGGMGGRGGVGEAVGSPARAAPAGAAARGEAAAVWPARAAAAVPRECPVRAAAAAQQPARAAVAAWDKPARAAALVRQAAAVAAQRPAREASR